MTWSRKDIIADIQRCGYKVDTSLPYWELRKEYCRTKYRTIYLGTGSFGAAHGAIENPPPQDKKMKEETGK